MYAIGITDVAFPCPGIVVDFFALTPRNALVGSADIGPVMEVCLSRMRYMAAQTSTAIRIVALSYSLAHAKV